MMEIQICYECYEELLKENAYLAAFWHELCIIAMRNNSTFYLCRKEFGAFKKLEEKRFLLSCDSHPYIKIKIQGIIEDKDILVLCRNKEHVV